MGRPFSFFWTSRQWVLNRSTLPHGPPQSAVQHPCGSAAICGSLPAPCWGVERFNTSSGAPLAAGCRPRLSGYWDDLAGSEPAASLRGTSLGWAG